MLGASTLVHNWGDMVDSFGAALRQLRLDRGWSLQQLAAKIRWSKSGVGMFETGERRPSIDFAIACDRALGTTPILTTLCGLGEDDDMRRRALLGGLATAVGVGAVSSYAALADVIRREVQEAAGVGEDWDTLIRSYQNRLVTEPSNVFGDELLASMLSARYQMTERRDPEAVRASAHLGLLYGLWMGNVGNVATGHNFYRTAALLAERTNDPETQVYVWARTAAGGPYQGLTRATTEKHIARALSLAGDRASAGALEAHAARVQLAALTGDLATGRTAISQMWHLADRLPATTEGPGPAQRTASFAAYLEGRLGTLRDARRASGDADMVLAGLPQWHAEARLYYALGLIRHGHLDEGLDVALRAARSLRYSVRVIRLGVDDVLLALPPGHRSDQADELRGHGTTGPKPWELVAP